MEVESKVAIYALDGQRFLLTPMVLGVLEYVYTHHFPSTYTTQVVGTLLVLYTLRTLSLGRKTSRDRTLAARTILLTSPFASSLGITLLCELASRGATVICLSDRLGEAQDLLVSTLREECKNESIFVELCDITLPSSIQTFVGHFLKKENSHNRIDAVVFAHEYPHVGHYLSSNGEEEQRERDKRSLGTFLLTTLLLPNLLVAPQERDIRIVNVVNPFYAAAAKSSLTSQFPSISPSPTKEKKGLFLREGSRALRTIILSRHLQRILDSLPAAQVCPSSFSSKHAMLKLEDRSQKHPKVPTLSLWSTRKLNEVTSFPSPYLQGSVDMIQLHISFPRIYSVHSCTSFPLLVIWV